MLRLVKGGGNKAVENTDGGLEYVRKWAGKNFPENIHTVAREDGCIVLRVTDQCGKVEVITDPAWSKVVVAAQRLKKQIAI